MLASGLVWVFVAAGAVQPPDSEAGSTGLSYSEDGKEIFVAAYFERFAPQSAADMLFALPGFQIRFADQRRGIGQGGANILIDGSRVTGKSNDPLDVLRRTSKEAVERIEIVDGASLGISGLSGPVANVVLNTTKTTGNWEWDPQFRKGLAARLTAGSVSVSGTKNGVSYTVGLENDAFRNGAWGEELVTGPDGALIERRYESVQPYGDNPELSLKLGNKDAQGREFNFNASAALFDFEFSERSQRTPADPMASESLRVVEDTEEEWNAEISGDYAFDAFGGRMKLIGFQYYEHSPLTSQTKLTDDSGFVEGNRFERTVDEGETIVRVEQTWGLGDDRSLELGGEVVYNFNDATASLFELDANDNLIEVDFDGGNTKIEEQRAETSIAYNFKIGDKIDVQTSAAVEYSELKQSGDAENQRSFVRPKGFISATYRPVENLEIRGRIDRRVGQLNLFAFASRLDLNDGNGTNGNMELVPQQSWFLQGAIEKRFPDDSRMTLTVDYEDIEDIVQQIPIGDGEGPGNVAEATRMRVEFVGTQMLDKWGIPGGRLEWDYTVRDSEIKDPFSGEKRRLNGETKTFWEIEFRHDIPNTPYAYGFEVEEFENSEVFRRSQISLYDQSKPTYEVYVEHKDFFGVNAVFTSLTWRTSRKISGEISLTALGQTPRFCVGRLGHKALTRSSGLILAAIFNAGVFNNVSPSRLDLPPRLGLQGRAWGRHHRW